MAVTPAVSAGPAAKAAEELGLADSRRLLAGLLISVN